MNMVRLIMIILIFSICATVTNADILNSQVGIRRFSVFFQPTKSVIKGIVWYPTTVKSQKIKLGPYELDVARNAKIENGKHSLVVISHGSRGSHLGHRDTAIYLAERGYIVISVIHPKNNYLDDSLEGQMKIGSIALNISQVC